MIKKLTKLLSKVKWRGDFGEARLLELLLENRKLNAVELQKSVMAAVADFTHGVFQDDVTMLVVGVG